MTCACVRAHSSMCTVSAEDCVGAVMKSFPFRVCWHLRVQFPVQGSDWHFKQVIGGWEWFSLSVRTLLVGAPDRQTALGPGGCQEPPAAACARVGGREIAATGAV